MAPGNRRSFGSDDLEPVYDLGDPGLGDDVLEELGSTATTAWSGSGSGPPPPWTTGSARPRSWPSPGSTTNLKDTEQRRNLVSILEDEALEWYPQEPGGEPAELQCRPERGAPAGLRGVGTTRWPGPAPWRGTPPLRHGDRMGPGGPCSSRPASATRTTSPPTLPGSRGNYLFDVIEPGFSNTEGHRSHCIGEPLPPPSRPVTPREPSGSGGSSGTRTSCRTSQRRPSSWRHGGPLVLAPTTASASAGPSASPGDYPLPGIRPPAPGRWWASVDQFRNRLDGETGLEAETEN